MGHGGRLPAPPPKCRRRAAERMASYLGGGGSARHPPLLPLAAKRKKATQRRFCAEACALSRRSFVNNERPEALLCESSASNNRARRAGRSQQIDRAIFSGLRRAELACLRRFSFGLRRQTRARPKCQACGASLLLALTSRSLTRRACLVSEANLQQICLLLCSRSAYWAASVCFLLPSGYCSSGCVS